MKREWRPQRAWGASAWVCHRRTRGGRGVVQLVVSCGESCAGPRFSLPRTASDSQVLVSHRSPQPPLRSVPLAASISDAFKDESLVAHPWSLNSSYLVIHSSSSAIDYLRLRSASSLSNAFKDESLDAYPWSFPSSDLESHRPSSAKDNRSLPSAVPLSDAFRGVESLDAHPLPSLRTEDTHSLPGDREKVHRPGHLVQMLRPA